MVKYIYYADYLEDLSNMKDYIGKTVKYDVKSSVGLVIIKANSVIRSEHIELFNRHRIDPFHIIIDTERLTSSNPINQVVQQLVVDSTQLFQFIELKHEIPLNEFKQSIVPAVQKISADPNIFRLFQSVKARDNYTYQHNIGVGILATLIGQWLKLKPSELADLSLAATLHDVGKVTIPLEILHKKGKLTVDEYKLIQQHTIFGYQMLRETEGVSHKVALAALQHHEKEDGSGYPLGLKKDKIDLFSKVIAVADIFHAMSSRRPYHEPVPFHEIVSQMRQGLFGELEPRIVSVFLKNITRKMVGTQVVLMDGRLGEIVYVNPHDDMKPMIQINSVFIDLSKERNLQIKEIIS
jgi:HD-GYP domain-containing protein (c-di-GMP phosphodiesterase class II)